MPSIDALIAETAREMGASPLKTVPESMSGYAETDGETLFYSPSFMSQVESAAGEDGVRFVVAHEMGHQVGGMDHGGHGGEYMADELATRAMARMGADFDAIAGVFTLLNGPGSETHPASTSRSSRAQTIHNQERSLVVDDTVELDVDKKKNPNVRDLAL